MTKVLESNFPPADSCLLLGRMCARSPTGFRKRLPLVVDALAPKLLDYNAQRSKGGNESDWGGVVR